MTVYRYTAVPLEGAGRSPPVVGELAAESPVALRASLRRIGLQVIDLRPARRPLSISDSPPLRWAGPLVATVQRHARTRRTRPKAELFDSLATMLEAGMPIVEAVATLATTRGRSGARTMLVQLREHLREGSALDESMEQSPWWFEPAEVAMVRAGRASGELPGVLRSLAERHERAGALSTKMIGALIYPAVVSCVGVGVVVFLSVKTLPELVGILRDAGIEPPRLTLAIIAIGRALLRYGLAGSLGICAITLGAVGMLAHLRRHGWSGPRFVRSLVPTFARQTLLARAWSHLADLIRTGVPLVDSLRITSPTVSGVVGGSLSRALAGAAAEIERGSPFAGALAAEPLWFDDECRRLVAIGETTGELADILTRLAQRTHRAATRSIDRVASVLEPGAILVLATLIGFVVMGAVLPILKLQEIIG